MPKGLFWLQAARMWTGLLQPAVFLMPGSLKSAQRGLAMMMPLASEACPARLHGQQGILRWQGRACLRAPAMLSIVNQQQQGGSSVGKSAKMVSQSIGGFSQKDLADAECTQPRLWDALHGVRPLPAACFVCY